MNILKKALAVALCAGMLLGMAACQETNAANSNIGTGSSSLLPDVPSVVESESSVASSQADSIPSESGTDTLSSALEAIDITKLPDIAVGTAAFREQFSQNQIDQAYLAGLETATSTSLIGQAISDAAERWKKMVDVAYQAALDSATEDERGNIKERQTAWVNDLDAQLYEIENSGREPMEIAELKMLHYREWAAELCNIKFEHDSSLPSFDVDNIDTAAG